MMICVAWFVLGIIFLVIVGRLWIIFHYLTRWGAARRLSGEFGYQA